MGSLVSEAIDPANTNFLKDFHMIANYGDFWAWSETVLYENVFKCCYYNDEGFGSRYGPANEFQVAKYNRLITPIRFRQIRTKVDRCAVPRVAHDLSRPCWNYWVSSQEDKNDIWSYNPTRSSSGSQFVTGMSMLVGDEDDGQIYGDSGHVVDLPLNAGEAAERIRGMIHERWTDEWTRALAIDLNTYNPNHDMATAFRFRIDIVPGGHFFPRVDAKTCRLHPYSSGLDLFRVRSSLCSSSCCSTSGWWSSTRCAGREGRTWTISGTGWSV